jgi:hypothetical protein
MDPVSLLEEFQRRRNCVGGAALKVPLKLDRRAMLPKIDAGREHGGFLHDLCVMPVPMIREIG